jgi:hypothetical protein
MGRKKLHRTREEIREQNRLRAQKYYERHGDDIKRKRMERYWEKVGKKLS